MRSSAGRDLPQKPKIVIPSYADREKAARREAPRRQHLRRAAQARPRHVTADRADGA